MALTIRVNYEDNGLSHTQSDSRLSLWDLESHSECLLIFLDSAINTCVGLDTYTHGIFIHKDVYDMGRSTHGHTYMYENIVFGRQFNYAYDLKNYVSKKKLINLVHSLQTRLYNIIKFNIIILLLYSQ